MKRKYAAMVLGLTLALTSLNMAYAADKDTDTAQTTEAATEDENAAARIQPNEGADAVLYVLGLREGLVRTDITIRPQLHRIARK